jgi:UDP-N-acetylmuramate dehydrogenase
MHPLDKLCTLSIGGPARYFLEVHSPEEMQQAVKYCHLNKIAYFILGKGSNCLFSDEGFNGLVILNKISFLNHTSSTIFHVGSGYSFSLLGVQTARLGLSGLEFASGIPATVGGAVYMNAGANGTETCDHLLSVDYVDEFGAQKNLLREELKFAYRHSPFQKLTGAIVGATFQLKSDPQARQKQLDILAYRKKTQPYGTKSAGCIFQNPNGDNAGRLIESCGLKGTHVGEAEVSHVHANFLINKGAATANELLSLISEVKQKVKTSTGIELQSELRIIPYHREQV